MSNLTPLLTACPPRPMQQASDQYAADLIRGLDDELATAASAADFLQATYLTRAAADFLRMATDRIARGRDSASPSVYQLYSRYGGGKTHSLLLLAAAAKYPDLPYWTDEADCPTTAAQIVAFDGEKHNVVNGAALDDAGNRAQSLAGYLLYQLGGPAALHEFGAGDALLTDPGAATFQRLIGDQPIIIIIDELVHYISRVQQYRGGPNQSGAAGILTTLSALANAVTNSPRAVLVITVPEDSSDLLLPGEGNPTGADAAAAAADNEGAGDAFRANALSLIETLHQINSQLGRVMHPVAPSGADDLPAILRKRLFYAVDDDARRNTADAYAGIAARNGRGNTILDYPGFYDTYPFHPALLYLITSRLAANRNFQRVRGTLRLLGNALREMQTAGSAAALVHPQHITPRVEPIRTELVNRIGFAELDPAIDTDIVGRDSTAAKTGSDLAEPAAVTMLLGTIAPDASNGLYADQIADALLAPEHADYGVIANAIADFLSRAIYVDDSPDTQRKRFSKDANVMKELLEAKDSILSDTNAMSTLLRQAITSAYSGGVGGGGRRGSDRRGADRLEVMLFPSRQSNVPDYPDRAVLGIVNPDHWNWTDAANPVLGMSNQDLLDLHRHRSGSDGAAPREYPNNALLLAAHDANLSRIRDDIATLEAAERLLQDGTRALPQHRRDTLASIRAAAEKNATTGVQNKFTHLFSAGNGVQHQWPEPHSHLEHRALESITDAAGKGQESILNALGDRLLRGANAGLSRSAWARIGSIANPQGSTLGELRDYIARTPDARIIINDATWRAIVANAVAHDALHLMTPHGEINPSGYDPGWLVWAKGYEPQPDPVPDPGLDLDAPPPPSSESESTPAGDYRTRQTAFTSTLMSGSAAYAAVRQFMADNGHDWPALISCAVTGTRPVLADQIANIAQGDDAGIAITLRAQNQRLQVGIIGAPPSEYKDYARQAQRMLTRAGVAIADVTVQLDAAAAPRILEKLNNRDEANISVAFRPPESFR